MLWNLKLMNFNVTINDFIDDSNLTSINLGGNLINNEIPINNICPESEILIFLDKIIKIII